MRHLRYPAFPALCALCASAALAQNEPVIVEAEDGVFGPPTATGGWQTATLNGVTYITNTIDGAGDNPAEPARVVTYTVTFPSAGTYDLYARFRVGPTGGGANDDSFFYGAGFGPRAFNGAEWITINNVQGSGYVNPTDKVVGGGFSGTQVFKWLRLTAFSGQEAPFPAWVVTDGNLTQTFQVGSRENGLFIDKLAFGRQGLFYTVNDLDNRLPGSDIPPPPPFTPSGPPIATGQDKFLGSALSNFQRTSFELYWNKVTPENASKWGSVENQRNNMQWGELDQWYQLAKTNGFPFHFHTLVWGNQQPPWMEQLTDPAEKLAEIRQWFELVHERYPDIDFLEVVNEPLHDPPTPGSGNYIDALGGTGTTGFDWILNAFRLAREVFGPNQKLMLNDFSITNSDASTTQYLRIIEALQAEGLIDIIGEQGHAFSTTPNIPMSTHANNLTRLGATGLPIHITEFDIDGLLDEEQLASYQRVFPTFWEHPSVTGITLWGFRPGHWRSAFGAYIVLDNGAERLAMKWLQQYVQNKLPVVTADQMFSVSESATAGTALGNVLATDADAGQSLSQWRIDGGTGAALFAIDAASGSVSLTGSLDFETATSYTLNVSVYDGFRRSASQAVAISVTNANDNAPAINAASFRIDGGFRFLLGNATAMDTDDTHQPGFTTLQGWQIVGGNGGSIFVLDGATGALRINRPLLIDFRKSSYTLLATVSDGLNTSPQQTLTVTIPNHVRTCTFGIELVIPKKLAPLALHLGGTLGPCRRP